MKTHAHLLAACASIALFAIPASADTTPTCAVCGTPCAVCEAHQASKPHPIKIVNPTDLPRNFVKSTVTLLMNLDENGVPSAIHPISRIDSEVAARVVSAVSQWRFSPLVVGGVPVAGSVVLPIEITATDGA